MSAKHLEETETVSRGQQDLHNKLIKVLEQLYFDMFNINEVYIEEIKQDSNYESMRDSDESKPTKQKSKKKVIGMRYIEAVHKIWDTW